MGTVFKAIVITLGILIAGVIAGIIGCAIFDILPLRFMSAAVFYAIWLVVGIFCGLFIYDHAGSWSSPKPDPGTRNLTDDWSGLPDAKRIGNAVFATAVILIIAMLVGFYPLLWDGNWGSGYGIPDSFTHSATYLISVLIGLGVARFSLMPTREGPIQ